MKLYYYVLIFILLFFFAIGLCSVSKPTPPKAFSYNEIHNYDYDLASESGKHGLHWGKSNKKAKTFLPYLKNYNTGIYFLPCVIIQTNEGSIINFEKARKDKNQDEKKYAGLEYTPSLGIQAIYYSRKEDNAEPLKFDYIVFNIDDTEYKIDYKSAVQGSEKNDNRYMEWYCYSAREKDINILKEICSSHKTYITAYAKDTPSKK